METPFCSEAFKENERLSGKKEQSTCSIPLIWGDIACKHVTFSSYSLCKLAVLVTGLLCVLNPWRGNTQQAQTLSTFGYIHAEKFSVRLSKVHSNIGVHERPSGTSVTRRWSCTWNAVLCVKSEPFPVETSSLQCDKCPARRKVYNLKTQVGFLLLFIQYCEWPPTDAALFINSRAALMRFRAIFQTAWSHLRFPVRVPLHPDPDLTFSPQLLTTHHLYWFIPLSFSSRSSFHRGNVCV